MGSNPTLVNFFVLTHCGYSQTTFLTRLSRALPSQFSVQAESKTLHTGALESVPSSRASNTPKHRPNSKSSTQTLFRFDLPPLTCHTSGLRPHPPFTPSPLFPSNPLARWSLKLAGQLFAIALRSPTPPPHLHQRQRKQ